MDTSHPPAVDVSAFMPSSLYSEGPTPAALQEMLDNIDKYTEQVRNNLFSSLISALSGPAADPQVLSAMVGLADVASSSGTEQLVAQYASQYMEMQQQVVALQAELKAAQAAADLEATLNEFHTFIHNGQYRDAAYSLVQLRKILEDSSSSSSSGQGGGREVLQGSELAALQAACASCEQTLDQALSSSLSQAFVVDWQQQSLTLHCRLGSGADVADVWEAMELAGSLSKHMQTVAGFLLQELVPQLLHGSTQLHISSSPEGALLQWHAPAQTSNTTTSSSSSDQIEGQISQLLSALAQSLFRQQPATLAAFGAAFWAPFVGQYQATFQQQIQGSSVAVLLARQEAATNMEQQAVAMGLAEPGSELARCLSRSIQQSYHAVQEQFLAQARELLLAHDPQGEAVTVGQPLPLDADFITRIRESKAQAWELLDPPSGWDTSGPVLATGYYNISSTALQLVMLMDDALAQACHHGDTSTAQAIIGAVSKVALLYLSLLPAPSAREAPVLLLLRHNDLQYISHHLLVAPFLFDPELKQLLGAGLWFGNEALQLRAAAKATLNELLQEQRAALHSDLQQLLEQSAALSTPGKPSAARRDGRDAAAAAAQPVLYSLTRAGRLLWQQLAPAVALEASRELLEDVSGVVLRDVLAKKDIGSDECPLLYGLWSPLVSGLLGGLVAEVDLSSQEVQLGGVDLKQLVTDALHSRCRSLRKAHIVLQLLQASLASIVADWESGALPSEGLSLAEVTGLVQALFEDTDDRAAALQRIEVAADSN